MTAPRYSENQLQVSCVEYLHKCAKPDAIYTHVANGGKQTDAQRIHKWRMGELAGWPDFQIFRGGHAYMVEFKVGNAKLTDKQEAVKARLERMCIPVAVIRTPEEFQAQMREWGIVP